MQTQNPEPSTPVPAYSYVVTITFFDDIGGNCRGSILLFDRKNAGRAAREWAERKKLDFLFCEYEVTTVDGVME